MRTPDRKLQRKTGSGLSKLSGRRLIPVLLIGTLLLGVGVVGAILMFRPQSHGVALALSSPGRSPILASPQSSAPESASPAASTPTPAASESPSPKTPAAA